MPNEKEYEVKHSLNREDSKTVGKNLDYEK